ncbi:MAG: hypothetical protein IKN53_01920, partial [Oscillibacter sp.]|nr:hypothetical protein [Oscillibacter sp.]
EGARRSIVRLDRQKVRVTADVSGITSAGVQTVNYRIAFTDLRFTSDSVKVKDSSFYVATVEICELNRKNVDVRYEVIGTVADGYSAGELHLSDTTVELSGQESDLEKVEYAKIELSIGSNATDTVSQTLPFKLYDAEGNEVSNSRLHLSKTQIQATLPITVTRELALRVDFTEAPGAMLEDMEWSLLPESILVSGEARVLNGMEELVLDTIDLLEITPSMTEKMYSIIIPEGCENLSGVTKATLRIAYPARTSEVHRTERIECVSTPAGKTVEILTDALDVQLFGTTHALAELSSEDVTAVADLTDFSEASGTYTVPCEIRIAEEKNVGVSGTYQIQIRISDAEA